MNTESGFELLRIFVPASADLGALQWVGFNTHKHPVAHGQDSVQALPASRRLQLIVPASQLAAHLVAVPPGSGRHLQAIVQQALEDTMLGSRDATHVVTGESTPAGRKVWVVNLAWLRSILNAFEAAGRQFDEAYAEFELLPEKDHAVWAQTPSGCLFRTATGETGLLDDVALLGELVNDPQLIEQPDLLDQALSSKACNLLTGALQPRQANKFDLHVFRRSGWLLLGLLVILLLSAIVRWQQLEMREKALRAEIRQTFATAFPGTPIVMDPFKQWDARRRESGTGENYVRDDLDLIANLANTLGPDVHPRSIESRDGTIRVLLTESDAAKIRETMEKSGKPHEFMPAEAGFTRLEIRRTAKP